jgi:molybdate transport system regulatory protein
MVASMARLSIRIDFESSGRLGPGKIALLERIEETGSIAAAGKTMGMSYRRAWELVSDLNALFDQPLVAARVGGRKGGGTALTPFGKAIVKRYRAVEQAAQKAARAHMRALEAAIRPS